MRICLISRDRRIERLCRAVAAEWPVIGYQCAPGAAKAPPAELYLRDLAVPEARASEGSLASGAEHVFLARREQLPELHERFAAEPLAVLLKPVKRAALRSLLERAVERRQPKASRYSTERDELLECLLLASFRLQQHSLERTNFLARALHDFRAPLTAANGYCGLLLAQAFGPLGDEQLQTLRRMQHSIQRLSRMANAMFQLSLGRLVQDEPRLLPGDIGACVEQAVYEIAPAAEAREIELKVEVSRAEDPLVFDGAQIEQVLVNLLENACKFSPRRGVVELRGYPLRWPAAGFAVQAADGDGYVAVDGKGANAYRLDIRDAGPGVPAEHAERIFEQYVSYSGSHDRSGTGLGLAICRMILAAHHGEVFAEPRDGGATFSIVLPFVRQQPQGAAKPSGDLAAAALLARWA